MPLEPISPVADATPAGEAAGVTGDALAVPPAEAARQTAAAGRPVPSLSRRLLRRSLDLIVIAWVVGVGLSTGSQLIEWWRGADGPPVAFNPDTGADWQMRTLDVTVGGQQQGLTREPFFGNRAQVETRLMQLLDRQLERSVGPHSSGPQSASSGSSARLVNATVEQTLAAHPQPRIRADGRGQLYVMPQPGFPFVIATEEPLWRFAEPPNDRPGSIATTPGLIPPATESPGGSRPVETDHPKGRKATVAARDDDRPADISDQRRRIVASAIALPQGEQRWTLIVLGPAGSSVRSAWLQAPPSAEPVLAWSDDEGRAVGVFQGTGPLNDVVMHWRRLAGTIPLKPVGYEPTHADSPTPLSRSGPSSSALSPANSASTTQPAVANSRTSDSVHANQPRPTTPRALNQSSGPATADSTRYAFRLRTASEEIELLVERRSSMVPADPQLPATEAPTSWLATVWVTPHPVNRLDSRVTRAETNGAAPSPEDADDSATSSGRPPELPRSQRGGSNQSELSPTPLVPSPRDQAPTVPDVNVSPLPLSSTPRPEATGSASPRPTQGLPTPLEPGPIRPPPVPREP